MKILSIVTGLILFMAQINFAQENDPFLWLEEVEGKKALEWVEKWNEKTDFISCRQKRFD